MRDVPKYTWTYSDEREMFFWSDNSTNTFLSGEPLVMSRELVNSKSPKKLVSVSKNAPNIFSKYGIIRLGFSEKTKNYYQVIGKNPFLTMFLLENGELSININRTKKILRKGDLLIIPPKAENITIQVNKGKVSILWAHIRASKFKTKKDSLSIEIQQNLPDAKLLFMLARSYELELYSKNPSIIVLSNLAQVVTEILSRSIEPQINERKNIENKVLLFLEKLKMSNSQILSIKDVAKKLNLKTFELNSICLEKFALSFPKLVLKYRLDSALKLLKEGKSVAKVSKDLGYSSPYAFSRAFKTYYEISPSEYAKK